MTKSNLVCTPPMASLLRPLPFPVVISAASFDKNYTGLSWKPTETLKLNTSSLRLVREQDACGRSFGSVERKCCTIMASKDPCGLGQDIKETETPRQDWNDNVSDPLEELKERFLKFKKQNYVKNLDHYQKLAEDQSPKFMVIACADSRVCPSKILGFQPGEAFTVRNVANLVPPYQHGNSETSAALEFAVNSLEVANILVIGHSRCGGIRALMSMNHRTYSKSFIKDWVSIAKSARLRTEAAAGNQSFEEQCIHCEKESVSSSLLNLLTYPWIGKKVTERSLSLHGGYYDFINCSFEKWTLDYREGDSNLAIKNCSTWS